MSVTEDRFTKGVPTKMKMTVKEGAAVFPESGYVKIHH